MANKDKLQLYQSIAEQTAKEITNKRGSWTNFLDTSAKLYKYSFPEQLLIHAQKPDVTACATIETWNDNFNRWVKRGTKGIALIDDSGSYPRLKYVFDVNDTETSLYNSRPVFIWEMRQEHKIPVMQHLAGIYEDIDVNGTLADSFRGIAKQLAQEYYEDNAREIRYRAEDSFLESLDDLNLGTEFENALTNSIAYTLMSRCGFDADEHFDDDDFQYIFDFNTPDMVYALGTAANELSAQVLRDIETIIKKHERQKAAERSTENEHSNNVHTSRGLSAPGHQTERTSEGYDRTSGTLRENEESVPERTPDDNVQHNVTERNAVSAPAGNGGSGEREISAGDESADGNERSAGQNERPDGLDGGDEHAESSSGRTGPKRSDLHLNEIHETPPRQIISEQSGVSLVNETLSQVGTRLAETLSASSVTLDEADSILRNGSNSENSILRISAHFSKNLTPEENTDFLRREYLSGRWGHRTEHSGKGYQFGTEKTAVWFDETGITIGRGKSALSAADYVHLTWKQAAERIKSLYDAGQYISHDLLDEALYNENKERASDIIEIYKNLTRGISDIQYELKKYMDKEQKETLKDDWKNYRYLINGLAELEHAATVEIDNGNNSPTEEILRLYDETIRLSEPLPQEWKFRAAHPEIAENMTELLRDRSENGGYSQILNRLRNDVNALENTADVPVHFYRNPYRALSNLEKAGLPAHGFPLADYQPLNFMRFITDDEIDSYLTHGGSYSEGKLRILSYFLHDNTPQERIKFLKDQYGNGGGTWFDGWSHAEPVKGIKLTRSGCEDAVLTWNQAVRRIEELINRGRYVSRSDLEKIPAYERIMLAKQINHFYYDLPPEEYERPFAEELDLNYPKEAEWTAVNEFLDDTERIDAVLAQMQYIYENTPEKDRYYSRRKQGFESLSAFRDGTYTLFPGLQNLPDLENAERRTASGIGGQNQNAAFADTNPADNESQLSLFDFMEQPDLPSADEQQAGIEQAHQPAAEADVPAVSAPVTQDEIDALLLTVNDEDKARLSSQFADNPRSKESVQLVREMYSGIEQSLPRLNGENSYIWIMGENTGVSIIDTDETLKLSWSSVIKRIGELMNDGRFTVTLEDTAEKDMAEPAAPLDFDTAAQIVFERVIEDKQFAERLEKAPNRGSLRNPINEAFDLIFTEETEKGDPQNLRPYFADDDLNDKLFSFVYQKVWEVRQQRESETAPQTETVSEISAPEESRQIQFTTLEDIEDELDRKVELMRNKPDYEKIREAVGYWKNWRNMSHLDGITADVICEKLCEVSDDEAVKWLSGVNWNDWRNSLGFVFFNDALKPSNSRIVNFRITDDHLGEGGAKTKFRNNIEAVKTLKSIEFENRTATSDEQEILSRYIGWGGLPQAFDPDNQQWHDEFLELKAALSPDEFESARASTLNAHYTSPTVIKAIYEAVERMGFQKGNILEPSCGVGNFFGLLPDSMRQSKLYGVELDSVTARIAQQLYPNADIKESGYEKTSMPDAFFDLAIGNVPFGSYGVADKRYDKHKFSIHDYFFAKTLDQVRPGGVIAFITSKFTLDKQNPDIRKYIAHRAELLGAVRLPNNAFLKNAGTETTMDIIFLQKRDRPMDIEPEWVHLGLTEDNIPVNRYFLDNPEMLLGKMALDERMNSKYGSNDATACLPADGADLAEQLKTALFNVQGTYTVEELDDIEGIDNHAIPADPNVKNFSYTAVNDTVYFRENSQMYPVELSAATLERIKGMISLRDCVHELINLQLNEWTSDEYIKEKQAELSALYDRFSAEYGLINSQGNNRAFNADSAYYLLCSLEILDEDGEFARKADMFSKRTIKQRTVITHVDTASEALAVSLGEKAYVDIGFMSELTGKDEQTLFSDLHGVIYADFNMDLSDNDTPYCEITGYSYRTADDFLSGNVREKLQKYQQALNILPETHEHYGSVKANAEALRAALPKDLDASEIAVRLGSTWIDPEYVQQFMYELLKTPHRSQSVYQVNYHKFTGEWQVTGKGKAQFSDINAAVTYGTHRMNAYQIIDDTLNLRDVRVYDYKEDADGKLKRELNKRETTLAQQKQEQIKQAFKDWIWKNPVRRQTLVKEYNEKFNSTRPREYDGSHITFSGVSPEITMRPHQLNAIAHILYGGNTLLAHVVGAGKTFEMVGAAMESKRLGLCHKSLFAVPNHLTEQWAGEFLRLYPSANILVATKKDFEMRNRKKFCAKIATGDYDAVIIGHSQLEKIPISHERQERHIQEQLWEIEEGILELKNSGGERFSVKQLEKTKKNLELRLEKLLNSKKRDDVVTFEQLGADRLYIDESHVFKNLFLYTKMRNVAGLSTSEAQKSSDLFMKCRYIDELTGNKGVIFATGTPISNSMSEMFTLQRYLQYDTLAAKNLTHFDCWASIFGETQTSIELAPEGTGYRARTRFAKFHNLPELMNMFKDVADIQTADMLKLPVPEVRFENIIVEPSEMQKELVQELSERAAAVHSQQVDPHSDNMLKITTDGRKIGLDQRLMNPLLPDFEGSKVNACTEKIYGIWEETKNNKLTQLVFSDFSTPNKDGRFNIYDDIRAKLIERGIPEHEIAFIHDADTETKKKELFAKVRQGRVRIMFGSTFKMGAGTNVQDKLVATHDVDCPWRPADLEQRAGRIVRQGNTNPEVQIFRYATSGTFDSYLWQIVENKQKFISQIMSSKSPVRSCEDVDETALSYAEIKALCAGNPLIAEKMNLDVEVAKLRMLKADYQSQHYRLEDELLRGYPEKITSVNERIAGIKKDIVVYTAESEKTTQLQSGISGSASVSAVFAGMTVNGVKYREKEPAAKALLECCKGVKDRNEVQIGEYMGFKMSLQYEHYGNIFRLNLRGNMTYQTDLGTDAFGNITRINNTLGDLPRALEKAKSQLDNLVAQQEAAKEELGKPFTLSDELDEKEARLALLNADLNIEGKGGIDVTNDPDNREETANEQDAKVCEDYEYEPDELGSDEPEYVSAKAKTPILETIRAYNAEQKSVVLGRKSAEYDI